MFLLTHKTKGFDIVKPSEITPKEIFQKRRALLTAGFGGAAACLLPGFAFAQEYVRPGKLAKLNTIPSQWKVADTVTKYSDATSYNNFYEFGTEKSDPAQYADTLKTRPWTVVVDGEVKKPKTFAIDDLIKLSTLEDRVYRLRCVEAWSMVIPWVGFSFSELMKVVEPTGNAKYVEFTSLADPKQMPGVRNPTLNFPYIEGLRIDEAQHPLSLLTFGMYGEVLPNQNGAPVRLVVPWKYGYKSAKSIVRIRFVERMPQTTWNLLVPEEYGFYSNVNPNISHRWSQRTERPIGASKNLTSLFAARRNTEMFNGYQEHVAALYKGMDLTKYY